MIDDYAINAEPDTRDNITPYDEIKTYQRKNHFYI